MKSKKQEEQRECRVGHRFISHVSAVNYSHSPNYSLKHHRVKTNKQNKKEKSLRMIKEIGLPLAALLVSLITLVYVGWQTHISNRTMRISNRPYVGIDSIPIPYFSQSRVSITIKNAGHTPAYNTHIVLRIELLPANTDHKVPYFRPEDRFPGQYFIPAGITKEISRDWENLTASDNNDIENRTRKFFVHGIIEYDDIFGERHSTEFGFRFTPAFSIEFCNNHNNADQVK